VVVVVALVELHPGGARHDRDPVVARRQPVVARRRQRAMVRPRRGARHAVLLLRLGVHRCAGEQRQAGVEEREARHHRSHGCRRL
jgi:hypothetical protein